MIRCQSCTAPANYADESKGTVAWRKLKQLQNFASQIIGPNGRLSKASEKKAKKKTKEKMD